MRNDGCALAIAAAWGLFILNCNRSSAGNKSLRSLLLSSFSTSNGGGGSSRTLSLEQERRQDTVGGRPARAGRRAAVTAIKSSVREFRQTKILLKKGLAAGCSSRRVDPRPESRRDLLARVPTACTCSTRYVRTFYERECRSACSSPEWRVALCSPTKWYYSRLE